MAKWTVILLFISGQLFCADPKRYRNSNFVCFPCKNYAKNTAEIFSTTSMETVFTIWPSIEGLLI